MWHTIVVVVLILLNSWGASGGSLPGTTNHSGRIILYAGTFILQFVLFLLIWFGISRKKVKMRELIGGRWRTPEDFLIDLGFAAGFWIVSALVIAALKIAMGLVDLHNPTQSLNEMKQALGPVIPQTRVELAAFLGLTVFAGLFEEIIFRGYLQRQLGALAGNIYVGVIGSAILFGAAHGYQGVRLMVLIAIYGALFGILAVLRKSLRPGMMAHAWQDAFSGIALFFS